MESKKQYINSWFFWVILILSIFLVYPFVEIFLKLILSSEGPILPFIKAFSRMSYTGSLVNSIFVSTVSSLISCFISIWILTSILYVRNTTLMKFCQTILLFPLFFPDTLLGLLYAIGLNIYDIKIGLFPIIISYSITGIGFTFFFLLILCSNMIEPLILVAKDFGTGIFKTYFLVVIPIIFKKIFLLTMILATSLLNEFTIAYYVSTTGSSTLPVTIFSSLRFGVKAEIYALLFVIWFVSGLFIILGLGVERVKR